MAKNEEFRIVLDKQGDEEFVLTNDGFYQIVSKFDADAPDGFQEFRTTKILDPDASAMPVNLAVWDEQRKMYDTGMTEYSAALTRMFPDIEARRVVLRAITKYILNPMIERRGNVFEPNNVEFWDKESFTISLDHVFDTRKVEDLYALYLLVLHGNLAPKEFESTPKYKNYCYYSVENRDQVVDLKHKRELEYNEAIALFFTLLNSNEKELMALLDWMKISNSADTDKALLNSIFTRWLKEDMNQNPRDFLKIYEDMIKSPSGKRELEMYSNLVFLRKEGKVKQAFNTIKLDGEDIGANMKDATKNVLADEELTERVLKLLD